MAKQYYGCIRLTKHNPGWSDPINDIHLLRTHRTFKCVLEDYDLRPIMKGIKEGLIEFTRADIEGTADSDDGARLPMYCGSCICQAHLIKEGVLADYQADVDYQSDLEWQPPQPAERPAPTPSVQITGPSQLEAGAEEVFQVKLDQLKPKKEQVPVDADGDGVTDTDADGNEIFEEKEVHQTVTVNVAATGGTVEPTTLTFSSDPESPDYYMNAKEVKFTAPEESANVSIEFSGDGVKPFSKNVKVQGDEPIPEEPEQVVQPVVKINGKSDKIVLDSRKSSFEADITVEYGSCSADAIKLEDIVFNVVPASGVTGGSPDQLDGAAHMTFANLGTVAATEESLLATIKIQGGPCADGHQINQEIKIYVPEKPAEQHMLYWSKTIPCLGRTEDEFGPVKSMQEHLDICSRTYESLFTQMTAEPLKIPTDGLDISKGNGKQSVFAVPVEAGCTVTVKSSNQDVTRSQWGKVNVTYNGKEYIMYTHVGLVTATEMLLYLS